MSFEWSLTLLLITLLVIYAAPKIPHPLFLLDDMHHSRSHSLIRGLSRNYMIIVPVQQTSPLSVAKLARMSTQNKRGRVGFSGGGQSSKIVLPFPN